MIAAPLGDSTMAAAAMSSETNTNPSSGRKTVTLYLDLDDLANPEIANRLHDDGAHDHHLAHLFLEQQIHVLGIHPRQHHTQRGRECQQYIAGETAVRRVDPDLPQNLESLAHHVCEVVENLRQVAARFSLNQHSSDEEPHIQMRHSLGQLVQRVLQWKTEVLLLEALLELDANGCRQFVRAHAHRRLKRMTSANRSRQQVERLRKLLLESLHARVFAISQIAVRQRQADEPRARPGERL